MESKKPINPFNQPIAETISANTGAPASPDLRGTTSNHGGNQGSAPTSSDAIVGDTKSQNQTHMENSESQESSESQEGQYSRPSRRSWLMFGITCFLLMLIYIYNSGHANKGLRTKEKLSKELKELNSESISLESEITNASTQSALAERLVGTGLKEITTPPIKLVKKKKDE